jgi:hypothetical protein
MASISLLPPALSLLASVVLRLAALVAGAEAEPVAGDGLLLHPARITARTQPAAKTTLFNLRFARFIAL